jgi:hypothetical protein
MNSDNQPATRIRHGYITGFVRRNYFRVELDDGQEIVAAMPESLFHVYDPNVPLTRYNRPYVEVIMRRPPQMHRIIRARWSYMLGAPWIVPQELDEDGGPSPL